MQTQRGFNNARTLFGIGRIPTDNQIRGLLDPVAPTAIWPAFDEALELVAGQRWITANGQRYRHLGLTILADDKYANQPTCKKFIEEGFHFILVCKPTSHPALYESLEVDRKGGFVQSLRRTEWTGREHLIYDYQFSNEVPLRDGGDALEVNCRPRPVGPK